MSATSGVNVLRYSALALGIFYGFSHQRNITATQKAAASKKDYEHKQHLIDQAKAEYTKSKAPASASASAASSSGSSTGLNQDPMSANFDLEAYMNALVAQKA
ncbi:ATP synthase E chain-domain-containing protein [Xylariaceae sp. FL1272]|nr:ATP synthase E chain-domain-containing protein [Xylariaceae sp. FL1272]